MKYLFLGILIIACDYLCLGQKENGFKHSKIDENKIAGIYFLNDTINNFSVTLEISKNKKFVSNKQTKDSKTIGKGKWLVNNDTLVFKQIETKQVPPSSIEIIYSENEIKFILLNNKLCIVSIDGKILKTATCLTRK